jgi:hypothetical protein
MRGTVISAAFGFAKRGPFFWPLHAVLSNGPYRPRPMGNRFSVNHRKNLVLDGEFLTAKNAENAEKRPGMFLPQKSTRIPKEKSGDI